MVLWGKEMCCLRFVGSQTHFLGRYICKDGQMMRSNRDEGGERAGLSGGWDGRNFPGSGFCLGLVTGRPWTASVPLSRVLCPGTAIPFLCLPICRGEAWYLCSDGDGALPTPTAFGHVANIVRMLKNHRIQMLYFLVCFVLL